MQGVAQEQVLQQRILPAEPPYPAEAQAAFDAIMPAGVPPLVLFTTLARDPRLFKRFRSGALLDRGHLSLREREIIIARTTSKCGSEYEWGVHITFFADKAELARDMQYSLVHGSWTDQCWSKEESALIHACDQLHASCDVDDALWDELTKSFSEGALMEFLMVAGFYRTVSYLTNALRLSPEPYAARFPDIRRMRAEDEYP